MKYIVVRTDTERDIVVVGKTNTSKEATEILRNDFEEWFWQAVDTSEDKSFEDVYEEYEGNLCELTETSAWLNNCHHIDFDWQIIDTTVDNILDKPLSMKELVLATTDEDTYITGNIAIDLTDLIGFGFEELLDGMSELLVDNSCLMDITYKAIDTTEDGRIVLRISGDASEIMEVNNDMWEELKSALFNEGTEALEDFTDMDLSNYDDKDVIDNLLDQVVEQMPDDVLVTYYRKYMA